MHILKKYKREAFYCCRLLALGFRWRWRWIFSPIFPACPIHFLFLCILHCSLPGSMFNSQSRAQLGDQATFALESAVGGQGFSTQPAAPPPATSSVTLGRSRFRSSKAVAVESCSFNFHEIIICFVIRASLAAMTGQPASHPANQPASQEQREQQNLSKDPESRSYEPGEREKPAARNQHSVARKAYNYTLKIF